MTAEEWWKRRGDTSRSSHSKSGPPVSQRHPMAGETVGFDPDRDNAIGGALLNTEHIGGTARRAPHFVRELEAVGWTVVPTAAAPLFISLGAMCDAVAAYLGGTGTLAELADCASVARGFLADSPLSRATPERSADEVDG